MKKALLFPITFLFLITFSLPAFSQNTSLEGTWIVDKIVIKKTVNGNSAVKAYNAKDYTNSFTQCPLKVNFTSNKITLEYHNGSKESGTYSIEGNNLKITIPATILNYRFTLSESNKIQLDYTLNYVIDGIDKVEEVYNFYGYRE